MTSRTLISEIWTEVFEEYAQMQQKNQYFNSRALPVSVIGKFILIGKEPLVFGLMNAIHWVEAVTLCGYSVEFVVQSKYSRFLFIRNFLDKEFEDGKFPTLLINAAQRIKVVHCEFYHPYMERFFDIMLGTNRNYLKVYCRDKMFGPVLRRTLKALIDQGVTVDLDVVTPYIKQYIEGYRLNTCTFGSGAVALGKINFYMREVNLELFHEYEGANPYLESIEKLSITKVVSPITATFLNFFHENFSNLQKLKFTVMSKEYLVGNNVLLPLLMNTKALIQQSSIPVLEVDIFVHSHLFNSISLANLEVLISQGFHINPQIEYTWQREENPGSLKSITLYPAKDTSF